MPVRRVAVIGTGPAGAIATDALVKEQAFDTIRVFERKGQIGGTWVFDPEYRPHIGSLQELIDHSADQPAEIPAQVPCDTPRTDATSSHATRFSDTGVYENLHSNLTPSTMSFTQEPLPETLSKQTIERYGHDAPFRHRSIIRDWVEQIFTRGGHDKLVELSTTVERAEKRGQEWILTLRKEKPGTDRDFWWQEEFDAVVVASGHYSVPYVPAIPGLVEYEKQFPGSVRHSKHFRSKHDFEGKKTIVVGGSVSAFDALHDIRTVSSGPVIASLRSPLAAFGWAPFTHPRIDVRPPIARVDPGTRHVYFADGSSASDVDAIFFATGYDFSFPFLPGARVEDRRIKGLYQHVFDIQDPTLGFVGMVSGGLTFRVFEWQAVALARVLAERAKLPSAADMERWETGHLAAKGQLGFFNISPDFQGYFETLRQTAAEPAPGTAARRLPKFENWWQDEFSKVIEARVGWWEREMLKAQHMQPDKGRAERAVVTEVRQVFT